MKLSFAGNNQCYKMVELNTLKNLQYDLCMFDTLSATDCMSCIMLDFDQEYDIITINS